jgi:hypothetical protein
MQIRTRLSMSADGYVVSPEGWPPVVHTGERDGDLLPFRPLATGIQVLEFVDRPRRSVIWFVTNSPAEPAGR